MTDKYKELREALDAGPTPGPWSVARSGWDENTDDVWYPLEGVKTSCVADARLIAAANPDTIRALLDERDALKSDICDYVTAASGLAAENARLRSSLRLLADWAEYEVGACPELTPGLPQARAALEQEQT